MIIWEAIFDSKYVGYETREKTLERERERERERGGRERERERERDREGGKGNSSSLIYFLCSANGILFK